MSDCPSTAPPTPGCCERCGANGERCDRSHNTEIALRSILVSGPDLSGIDSEPAKEHSSMLEATKRRGQLVKKYAVVFVVLVGGALLTSGLVELYFSYRESSTALAQIQQ